MGRVCVTAAIWLAVAVGMGAELPVTFDFEGAIGGEPRLPKPWKLLGHPTADPPTFQVVPDTAHGTVMRLHALRNQADGIYRRADVDLKKLPVISFFWKVARHPDGQVGTRRSDQAIKVQLDFGHRGFKRHVLSYRRTLDKRVGSVRKNVVVQLAHSQTETAKMPASSSWPVLS